MEGKGKQWSERGSDCHVPASLKPMSQPIRRAEDQGSRDEGHHKLIPQLVMLQHKCSIAELRNKLNLEPRSTSLG